MGASKPESLFIQRIHRAMGAHAPYHLKVNMPLAGGIPDVYYSGDGGDMWVEYKYDPRAGMGVRFVQPNLSPLQTRWLNQRWKEGRQVAVILGCETGVMIYQHGKWTVPMAPSFFQSNLVSEQEAANFILKRTTKWGQSELPSPESSGSSSPSSSGEPPSSGASTS